MQRLKRVCAIDTETRSDCGGTLQVVAGSAEPPPIGRILGHVQQCEELNDALARASPGRRGQTFNQKGG
jgi:hypothetical protein